MNVAASVRKDKEKNPEQYCQKCLWHTGGGNCPRHGGAACPICRKTKNMPGPVNPTGKRGGYQTCTDSFHSTQEAS